MFTFCLLNFLLTILFTVANLQHHLDLTSNKREYTFQK